MDKSKHAGRDLADASQSAGRDMYGVSGGIGNMFEMGNVDAYNQTVDQSFSNKPQLRDALKLGADALRGLSVADPLRQEVLNQYGKLTTELQKPQPDKTVLQYLWNGIATVAGNLQPILEVGKLLAAMFGIALPAILTGS